MIPRVRVKDDGDVRLAGEADCPESDDEQTFQDAETCDACWRFFLTFLTRMKHFGDGKSR